MSDLDDKLKDITLSFGLTCIKENYVSQNAVDDVIPQIKQAFADDAKQQLIDGKIHGVDVYEVEPNLMTGPEWYDRFEKELNIFHNQEDEPCYMFPRELMELAAKRAANLDTNE